MARATTETVKGARKAAAKPKAAKAAPAEKGPPAAKRARKAIAGDGMSLVIVESPAKAKTIKKYLGRAFDVRASVGHVKDLPKSKMGVDIEGGSFEPEYDV